MADQILSLIVGKVVDYLAVPVGRQFSYLFSYNGNLEEFRSQLRSLEMAGRDVKLLVEAAKRKGEVILPSVEDWLTRVNGITDESERFVEEEDAISKCCFNGPPNLKVRYHRSRKAKKKALEFDVIKKDGRFDSVALPAPPLPIGSMSNENEFDFESRMLVFNQIVDAIKDDGVGIIGIWGMPGIGKTTLVKRVGKYAKDEGLFEMVAIAVVSQEPSIKDIQAQIADKLGFKFTSESRVGRADQLFQRLLAEKKILVILDDIWDPLELNVIGIPSGSDQKSCKIILTSRIRGVCEEMRAGKIFKIDLLGANEALTLFLRMSGVDDRSSEEGLLAEKLSEECDRLPIAIVIVARSLFKKLPLHYTNMLNQLRNSDPGEKLCVIIKSSYNNLRRKEAKFFFLLCALFPEDYQIPVHVLLEYGLGLDLFESVNNVDEALVRAHTLASTLKSSSLLLDGWSDEFVKMHDVVRDVAPTIASEENRPFLVKSTTSWSEWRKKKAISLCPDDIKKFPDALECPQLEILMLYCRQPYLQLHDNFFVGMRNLLVLDMSDMEFVRLPESIAGLENLLTLRLIKCKLGDISAIGKLQNLVSLSFYRSNIEVLPKEVGELSNLKLLDLWRCETLKVITPGVIQNLSQLEVLRVEGSVLWSDGKEVCQPENASLSELIHLSRLMILQIYIRDASMLPNEVLFENLTKFKVSIGKGSFFGNEILRLEQFSWLGSQFLNLTSLSENDLSKSGIKMLMKKAQLLTLADISSIFVALPSDLGGYGSLKELTLWHCDNVNYVLDMNELEFPSLQRLHLKDLPQLREITRGQIPMMFVKKLEYLQLSDLPKLFRLWPSQAESMALANLTTMIVESCDELKYFFEQSTAESCSKLKELEVRDCTNLKAIYMSKEEEHDEVIVFPQLSCLQLSRLENLLSFSAKFTSESTLLCKQVILPALERLGINSLEKVEKIWHIHTPIESFFQLKVLKLIGCSKLLSVFPPQSTSSLQNLEKLYVEQCSLLEILFQSDSVPFAEGKEIIFFPRLRKLRLFYLPNLTAILSTTSPNVSQATVYFPILKTIHLEGLYSIKNIWHDKVSTKCFGQLQQLLVSHCNQLVEVFSCRLIPNLHCLEQVTIKECNLLEKLFQLDYCPVGENKTMTILKRLKILNLEVLPEFRQIWWIDDQRLYGVKVLFPTMEAMTLRKLHDLKSMVDLTSFPKLMKLELENNDHLHWTFDQLHMIQEVEVLVELIITDNWMWEKENRQVIATIPKLRKLQLCLNLESIEWSESLNQPKGFQSLTSLNFSYCFGLKSLLIPSAVSCLAQLQELSVNECESMESIVGETSEKHKVIEFSKLHTLSLYNLPCLSSFHNGECALKFPSLGNFLIKRCSRLKMFISMSREIHETSGQDFISEALFGQQVSFGRLSHLILKRLDLLEEIWHPEHPATTVGELSILEVKRCDKLSKIFPSNLLQGLQNLAKLHVKSCESLEHVFAVEDHPPFLSNLEELELYNLRKLKQLWWNENTNEIFGLPRLRTFSMNSCSALRVVFDASVANHLDNLESLSVMNCSSIVEIAPEKPGEKIVFPLLFTLKLRSLPCFKGFNESLVFPLAKSVFVDSSFNMNELRQNKKQFPQSTEFMVFSY